MSFWKKRMSYDEQIKELDKRNKEARYGLLKEQAGSYVIGWYNNFRRLKRFYYQKPSMSDSEYQFLIQKTLEECTKYCTCHMLLEGLGEISLAGMLIPCEQALSIKILSVASEYGFYEQDIAYAILIILMNDRIDEIVEFINYLKIVPESRLE